MELFAGTVVRRYKRFLVDVVLEDGTEITAHCPNSGSMKSCIGPDWPCLLSKSDNPKRKLPYTLEFTRNQNSWIVTNTHRANRVIAENLEKISPLAGYERLRREVPYGKNSRIDIYLEREGSPDCLVEIKSVTFLDDGKYQFPDAVSTRGQKHLQELINAKKEGFRAVMFFLVLREDGRAFKPAEHIDPTYARLLKEAQDHGVEILVWGSRMEPPAILPTKPIEFILT